MNNKICIIINCYNNDKIIKNVIFFIQNITNNYNLYVINNGNNIINNYNNDKLFIIDGDNSQYEFSGIQKCLNGINKEEYSLFILGTDALFNYPINFLDFINLDVINYAITNECFIGNIDSFMNNYNFDNFNINYWIRTSFILINSNLFKKIDYQFISYKNDFIFDADNNIKITIDNDLLKFINVWTTQIKYKYIKNINTKKTCIFNEWKLTNKLLKYGKIYDIMTIYLLSYNNTILTNKNIHVLLNLQNYIETHKMNNLDDLDYLKQIYLKQNLLK